MAKSRNLPVKYAVVDAFTDSAFKGNPAAVCLLEEEREASWLQSVASEFNISETCYLTRISEPHQSPDSSSIPRFNLRWFTPVAEVNLCGHATLAASHFCFTSGLVDGNIIDFSTLSGILRAKKVPASEYSATTNCHDNEADQQFFVELDFPVVPVTDYNSTDISLVSEALSNASVVDLKKTANEDLFAVLPSAAAVADLQPQFEKIFKFPGRGIIVSSLASPESEYDFISRFFCPKYGINEDPVCGSAHCALAAYWSKKLGKHDFLAYAASPRGGALKLHFDEQNSRVRLQGKAITVMEGSLLV
ncbi:hypothetical protein V2J09_016170 [Rumex salicifolius]